MSFDTQRQVVGREPLTIVELYLDYCPLTYGQGACEAALSSTVTNKCYNTRSTCQDLDAYAANVDTKTYRFCSSNADVPANMGFIPSVRRASFSPTKIDPGKSLGRRGQCSIVLQDHPHHDINIDKYVDDRSYDPYETGTFWAKFKVRNRYYNGRIMKVYSGYLTEPFDWENFQTRTYIIDQIDGPGSDGKVTITGRDILKLADDDRAVCPRPTLARLTNDMAVGAGNIDLLPAGAGDNFNVRDYMRIDKEIIQITGITGDNIQYVAGERGMFNTEEKEHKADDAVQLCKYFYQERVDDIMRELLVDYASIPVSYIDDDQWTDEAGVWLGGFYFTCLISKPTGVTQLLDELIQSSTSYIFWNELESLIKLIALQPPQAPPKLITDDNAVIKNTVRVNEKPDKRRTEVALYYTIINPVEKATDAENFQNLDLRIDVDAESAVQYNDIRTGKIYSRWIDGEVDELGIESLLTRYLAQFRNTPIEVRLRIDAKDLDIWTGDEFYLTHRNIVDNTGAAKQTLMRVIEASETVTGTYYDILAVEAEREFEGRYCYFQEEDTNDFEQIPIEERNFLGGWLCSDDTELMPDGSGAYLMP